MPFINSQDPGAPRVTVYICCSLKTRALKIYSNLEVQLHFHSLTPHLRLAQSYMASRTTRKCPAETNLSSNLAFFFFFSSKSDLQMPLIQQDSGRKSPGRTFWHEGVTVMLHFGQESQNGRRKFPHALILLPLPKGQYSQAIWTGPSDHSYLNIWAELLSQQS